MEKEIYIPEEWARVICHGLAWAANEGDLKDTLNGNWETDSDALLKWIAEHYPRVAEEFKYLY